MCRLKGAVILSYPGNTFHPSRMTVTGAGQEEIRVLPQDSPFRPYWWGIGLEGAGVDSRPDVGTYGRYEFQDLPPVPFAMTGDLAWLAVQPAHDEWSIGTEPATELPALLSACERLGVSLPPAFLALMRTPTLQRRIRSCTACFVDVAAEPVRSPVGDGYLVRFLADQQGCLYWYLYLTADGRDHAVVCSADFYGSEDTYEAEEGDGTEPDAIVFCGESFETFLCRYWLENEIWFADNDDAPMPDVAAEYIRRYREFNAGGQSVIG